MKKIEHIGIAVKDMKSAVDLYESLLNSPCYKTEEVESEGVMTAFFQAGPNKIELLSATRPDSPVQKFIDKRGEGIHHIAFLTDDIYAEISRLKSGGFEMINNEPKKGADGMLIAFLHPKSSHGVLIELCQPAVGLK